jgi:IS30 family transposase
VSHETIYRSLLFKPAGCSRKSCFAIFAQAHDPSIETGGSPCDGRGQINDIVSIRQRPAAVEDRAVPGHWEGDLLSGSKNSYIATLVERHTRYVMLTNKDTQTVVSALIKQAKKYRASCINR